MAKLKESSNKEPNMSEEKPNYLELVTRGIWKENPVAYQVLGICSALAVTVKMSTAIVMGIALTVVLYLLIDLL